MQDWYQSIYNSFCVLYNIHKPFPLCEDVLTHFVAYLYKEGLKAGAMKSYLAVTRYTQIALGLGNPHIEDMTRLKYVIRGMKRLTNGPTHPRLPITLPLLAQLQCVWSANRSNNDASTLWAKETICFFSFLRTGKVIAPSDSSFDPCVHLSVTDVSMHSHI